jgi:hypothetical protein
MSIPLHELYVLKGEAGPALERVKNALAWLVSPKAEGIGEKLIRDAHALHGKPVNIEVSSLGSNGYHYLLGDHKLIINPEHVDLMKIRDLNGTLQPVSLERLLAHELTHAGQPLAKETFNQQWQLQQRIFNELVGRLPEAERAAIYEPIERALETDTAQAMRPHIEEHFNRAGKLEYKAKEMLANDPSYQSYIEEFEVPAMKNENLVARMRGEPHRTDYLNGYEITPEAERKMAVDEMIERFLEAKQAVAKQDLAESARTTSSYTSYSSPTSGYQQSDKKGNIIAASALAAAAVVAGGIGYVSQSQKQSRDAKKSWATRMRYAAQLESPAQFAERN